MSVYRRLGKKLLRGLRRVRMLPPEVAGESRTGAGRGTAYERGVATPSQARGGTSRVASSARADPPSSTPAEVFVDNLAAITRLGPAGFGTRRKALGAAVVVAGISIGITITGASPNSSQSRVGAARGSNYERGVAIPSQARSAASRVASILGGSPRASQARLGVSRTVSLEAGRPVPSHNRSGSSRVSLRESGTGIQGQVRVGASRVAGLERAGAAASHRRDGSARGVSMERATGIQGQVRIGSSRAQAIDAGIAIPSHRRGAISRSETFEAARASPGQSRAAASRAASHDRASSAQMQLRGAWSIAPSYAVPEEPTAVQRSTFYCGGVCQRYRSTDTLTCGG